MGNCKTKGVRVIENEKVAPPPYEEGEALTPVDDKRLAGLVAAKDIEGLKAFLCDLTHFKELYTEENELEVARAWTLVGATGDQMAELYTKAYASTPFPSRKRAASTLHAIGEMLRDCGHFTQSLEFFDRALVIKIIEFGPESIKVASTLNSIGWSYSRLDQLDKVKDVWSRALAIRRKHAPPEGDHDLAISLTNIGLVLRDFRDFTASETMLKESIEMYVRVLGLLHKDTATAHHNLGLFYDTIQGRHNEAIEQYSRALAIKEVLYGPKHDTLAITLSNLGMIYEHQDLHHKALERFLRAIEIKEKTFGPDHPDVALFCINAGASFGRTGDFEKANTYLTRALKIRRIVFGPDHDSTLKVVAFFEVFGLPVPE